MYEKDDEVIVTMVDENDEAFNAILMDSISYDGHIYSLFIPEDEKELEEPQVIIMEYIEDGDDVIFSPVENEVLLDEIWEAYEAEFEEEE